MRVLRCLCFVFIPAVAVIPAQGQSQPSVSKDPQAVTILQQALSVAGGAAALSAIKDYSGTGTLVFHQSQAQQVTGTVTITGLGLGEFRMDSNLSTGTRSFSVSQGRTHRKREDGTVTHFPPTGPVPSSDAFPYITPIFPSGIGFPDQELIVALNSPQLTVSYKGIVQLDGRSVHDIQVQRVLPGQNSPGNLMADYNSIDLFIDASTLQLVMTQDIVPNRVIHQIRYSNYRATGGLVVPFFVSEQIGDQKTWEIQLYQINVNTGLQDTDFQL